MNNDNNFNEEIDYSYNTLDGMANLIYNKLTENEEDQPKWQVTDDLDGAGITINTFGGGNPRIEFYYKDRTIVIDIWEERK